MRKKQYCRIAAIFAMLGYTVAKNYQDNGKKWNKSSKDLRLKTSKKIPIFNDEGKEEAQNCWKNDKTDCKNSSTLSLHIAAYENFIEVDSENVKDWPKTSKALKSVESLSNFQDHFEFPRQQESNESKKSEVQQFKASQKLRSPNQSLQSNPTQPRRLLSSEYDASLGKAALFPCSDDSQARQCDACKSTAAGERLLRAGKIYCSHCYRCYHCQQEMKNDNCLILLDRLYCFGCEKEYNAQRYILAKCGSGPLVTTFL